MLLPAVRVWYDDSEGSPNLDGVSMFLAYRSTPLQTDPTILLIHLFLAYKPVLNLVVLPYFLRAK